MSQPPPGLNVFAGGMVMWIARLAIGDIRRTPVQAPGQRDGLEPDGQPIPILTVLSLTPVTRRSAAADPMPAINANPVPEDKQ